MASHMELHTTQKTGNSVCFSWKNNPKTWQLTVFAGKKTAKRSTEHILELCKELEEIEDLTAYSLNDEIQRKEILEILEKFLESLKKGDCDIFIRRYWYMDSISEISARHGISESRIKSSLYRSRKKLWERVKHLYGKRI